MRRPRSAPSENDTGTARPAGIRFTVGGASTGPTKPLHAMTGTTVYGAVAVAVLPAASVAVQVADAAPRLAVATGAHDADATPDVASAGPGAAVAGRLNPTGFGVTEGASVGFVASRLTVTDCAVVPPALVALQVKVVPAVSVDTAAGAQPVVNEIVESESLIDHDTVTSLVYQPFVPSVPVTVGVTLGPLSSVTV
jgi:hypothetical protein